MDIEIDFEEIKNEITYKVYNSQLNRYPYAHCETNNFLSDELTEMLLNNWPGADEFNSNIESDSVSGTKKDKEHPYNFRYQICLTNEKEINQINGEKRLVWQKFTELLCSSQIVQAFVTLYSSTLLRRFKFKDPNDLITKMNYGPRIHLLHDKTNYSLGPHTDNSGKVIVILIYFQSDLENNTKNSFGTSVYIPRDKGFTCSIGKHYPHTDFIKVFSANFKKNNAFSFCRTDNSFHGVEKVEDKAIERKLLQVSIYGEPR